MAGLGCSITITSNQIMGAESDITTEVYSGSYIDRLDKRYLSYKRFSAEGETAALINFTEKQLIVTQQGAISSRMEFIPGEITYNEYGTPGGKIILQVRTDSYTLEQIDDHIEIKIIYSILTGDYEAIKTDMNIMVKF